MARTIERANLSFPSSDILPPVNMISVPSLAVTLLIWICIEAPLPKPLRFSNLVTCPLAIAPKGITTFLSTLISLVTLKSIICPVVIFLVLISLRTSKGIKVPAFKTTSLSARVKERFIKANIMIATIGLTTNDLLNNVLIIQKFN